MPSPARDVAINVKDSASSAVVVVDAGEEAGLDRPSVHMVLPGAVYTPTGVVTPAPKSGRACFALDTAASAGEEAVGITYKFTLPELNKRSYFLLHEEPNVALPNLPCLAAFRKHLRCTVVLANMEICFVRNVQLARIIMAPSSADTLSLSSCRINLDRPADSKQHQENQSALGPVHDLFGKRPQHYMYYKRDLALILDEQMQHAKTALAQCSQELGFCDAAVLHELAHTFAAYQPAVLDEEIKGSHSPCDPRSHTSCIDDVAALVEAAMREVDVHSPDGLAALGMELMRMVRGVRVDVPMAQMLLQGACMSGHYELVRALLTERGVGLLEVDIIRRLRNAWVGYQRRELLQPSRRGDRAQTSDWLDYKCSAARAVLIAHQIIETLILRDDQGMTHSTQQQVEAAVAATRTGVWPTGGLKASDDGKQLTPRPAGSEPGGPSGRSPVDSPIHGRPLLAAAGTEAASEPPTPFLMATVLPASLARALLDGKLAAELDPAKWHRVTQLFRRPAACKPLALAMLHVVLAGKKEVQRAMEEKREAAAAAAEAASEALEASVMQAGTSDGEGLEYGDGEGSSRSSDRDRRSPHEACAEAEAEPGRYRSLHRLAVQACHLAVHSISLSTVSDAIVCIRVVHAWPAIELDMLNDLAAHFPQQAAQLLGAIPLHEVDLEDNVLPFRLPTGFATIAVSDKDAEEFRQGGSSGSTQDAAHFSTQLEEDVSIEASLLVLGRTWLSLLLLFWPAEFRSPTTHKLVRVLGNAVMAFLWQGPGSCCVALVFSIILAVLGLGTRLAVAVLRILYWSVLRPVWSLVTRRFPAVRTVAQNLRGTRTLTMFRQTTTRRRGDDVDETQVQENKDEDEEEFELRNFDTVTRHLGRGLWRTFVTNGHNNVIDWAVGWGKGSASISCRQVPIMVAYAPRDPSAPEPPPQGFFQHMLDKVLAPRRKQLDTSLLEKLLNAPGVHPSVYGSHLLRALILFKWNYFTKYFIILQLLLHITYMAVFLAYAFTIKDMDPVDGRDKGPGAHEVHCRLQEPTQVQIGLLSALAVMTVDFTIQELRQIRHFGLTFFTHTWDILDLSSVSLVIASIVMHFGCTSGVSPLTLRGLAAVQIVLLFMRVLYYAMASDKLGSFVRMVLETTSDLFMFFCFLSVVFVGFALAIVVSQGKYADEEQTFIKLFTMMYGDFDVNFLTDIESGALGLDALTRVLASVYMILVTIILLNLLISVISESYERIRENERWESLRNKALLVVESETQLFQSFLTRLYSSLTPSSKGDMDDGRRYLYIITPEYARRGIPADQEGEDVEEEVDAEEQEDDDGQWSGRLGEIKRHISTQARRTLNHVRREMGKVIAALEQNKHDDGREGMAGGSRGSGPSEDGRDLAAVATTETAGPVDASQPATLRPAIVKEPVQLDTRTVQELAGEVRELVSKEIRTLRSELLAEMKKMTDMVPQGRLAPLTAASPSGSPAASIQPGGASPTTCMPPVKGSSGSGSAHRIATLSEAPPKRRSQHNGPPEEQPKGGAT